MVATLPKRSTSSGWSTSSSSSSSSSLRKFSSFSLLSSVKCLWARPRCIQRRRCSWKWRWRCCLAKKLQLGTARQRESAQRKRRQEKLGLTCCWLDMRVRTRAEEGQCRLQLAANNQNLLPISLCLDWTEYIHICVCVWVVGFAPCLALWKTAKVSQSEAAAAAASN